MRFWTIKSIIVTLITVFSQCACWAQDFVYDHFTVEDGLPSSQVYETFEDDYGYIWFLTDRGLCRFDGYEFKTYTTNNGLTDNVFFEHYKDSNGSVWLIGNNKTITILYNEKGSPQFVPYRWNSIITGLNLAIPNQMKVVNGELMLTFIGMPNLLYISNEGEILDKPCSSNIRGIWDSSGVVLQRHAGFEYYYPADEDDPETKKLKFSKLFRSVLLSRNARVRIVEKQNILISNFSKQTKVKFEVTPMAVGAFTDSTFWVSFAKGGVQIMDLEGRKLRYFLSEYTISDVYMDRENNYWFNTLNNGLFHTRNASINSLTQQESFMNIVADPNGNITANTFEGDIYKINTERELKLIRTSEDQKGAQICYSPKQKSIVGQNNAKFFFLDQVIDVHKEMNGSSRAIIEIDGKLAISSFSGYMELTYDGQINRYDSPFNVNDACSFNGKTYCATNTGIYRVENSELKRIGPWKVRIECVDSIGDNLLVGSLGFGLFIVSGKGRIIHLDRSQIGTDFINQIFVENRHEFWVCTTCGISKVMLNQQDEVYQIERLDYQDGLISNEAQDLAIVNDTVWVATTAGICYFPKSVVQNQKRDEHNYFLKFMDPQVNDHHCDIDDSELSHNENRIQFEFRAISFNQFDEIQYRYRLEGVEKNWNYTTSRKAVYPELLPGDYRFVVQVKGRNAHWGFQEISWQFTIHPPFWKTWWFLSIVSGMLTLLIYLFFKFRILLYNADLVREILRQIVKRLKKETGYLIVKESGNTVKIASSSIFYIKSDGNYLEIHHKNGKTVIREKIGNFLNLVPDPLEYLRVRRSFIIRIDQVQEKGKKEVVVNGETIQIGKTYLGELDKIQL